MRCGFGARVILRRKINSMVIGVGQNRFDLSVNLSGSCWLFLK